MDTDDAEAGAEDLERLHPAEILARRPDPVMPPVPPATRLPAFELSPEVFERLILEYVWSVEAARDVHIYGRRGQKQYGLDIVGEDREGRRFVYQVRRLETVSASAIRAAVVDYAGPLVKAVVQRHAVLRPHDLSSPRPPAFTTTQRWSTRSLPYRTSIGATSRFRSLASSISL